NSLIVQFALPRDQAQYPHPEVQGWTNALRSKQDPRFGQFTNWIGRGLRAIEPKYGFEFPLPGTPKAAPAAEEAKPENTQQPPPPPKKDNQPNNTTNNKDANA